jgi:hypothetical protein
MSDHVSCVSDICSVNLSEQIKQKRGGRRKLVRHAGTLCSKCLDCPPSPGQGYCNRCHADYERDRRKAERAELKRLRAEHEGASHG